MELWAAGLDIAVLPAPATGCERYAPDLIVAVTGKIALIARGAFRLPYGK